MNVRLINPEPEDVGNELGVIVDEYPRGDVRVRWMDGVETIVARARLTLVVPTAAFVSGCSSSQIQAFNDLSWPGAIAFAAMCGATAYVLRGFTS